MKTMKVVVQQVLEILEKFDRMPKNPDKSVLKRVVRQQLEEFGLIRFSVFICPKFKPWVLFSSEPEEYMPTVAIREDLFMPRVSKIKELAQEFRFLGIPIELNFLIGDNDAQIYIFPFLRGLKIDSAIFLRKQQLYEKSFGAKAQRLLGQPCIVWSLGIMEIKPDKAEPKISQEELDRELCFFQWLFSDEGPYQGMLKFSEDILREMVRLKFKLYGAQGKFLEEIGGILLQTEGPGMWLQRTKMLRCAGSKAIPAIYPWIRQEEL